MEYLIRYITDSSGHTFTEVIKPRENERYEIVSAENKEEAEEMATGGKSRLFDVKEIVLMSIIIFIFKFLL